MEKVLVNSESEFMKIFSDWDTQDIEHFLGIEFPYEDGTFQSDYWKGQKINEDQEVVTSSYRKEEDSLFPEEYPCVVIHWFENTFDRFGNVTFKVMEFVYQKDFKKP